MIRINHWSEWQDNVDSKPREAFFFTRSQDDWRWWKEIEPSLEMRAALDLMEPFTFCGRVDSKSRDCKSFDLEDDVFESLEYRYVKTL